MFKIFLAKQFFTYILAIATIFVLPLWPAALAQNTGEIPEFIYSQLIGYPNTSLQVIWPDLEPVLSHPDLVDLQVSSNLETNKLSLPISFTGKNLPDLTTNYNLAAQSIIQGLKQGKELEAKFLSQTASLSEQDLNNQMDQMSVLANINADEIANFITIDPKKDAEIIVSKVIINSKTPIQALDKFSEKVINENQGQTPKKAPTPEKTKTVLKNQAKTVKVTAKYQDYKNKIDQINQKIKTSTNYSPTDANFDSKKTQINSKLDSKDQKPTIILGKETFGEIALPPTLSESFEVVDSSEVAQSIPMDKAQNKKDDKIKMTRTKILNPNSITPDKIKQNQLEADKERTKALEHNQKFPQFYSPETQKAIDSSSQNNQNLIQTSLGKIGAIFGPISTEARGLSNPSQALLIYNRSNTGLAWDLPWGNTANGTQPGLWHRQGSWNQLFYFNNDDNTIRIGGKCLESAGNVYNLGTQVRLWDCNGVDGQKWVMDGSEMKPKYTFDRGIGFCLDTINGINTNGRSILWGCNGTSAQNWRAGDNDFSRTYTMKIFAATSGTFSSIPGQTGHVLVGIFSPNLFFPLQNTFSSWPGYDGDSNNSNRYNNIADYDSIFVDKIDDVNVAIGGNYPTWKSKSANISKTTSDYIRFGGGYRQKYYNLDVYSSYNLSSRNCASYSAKLWDSFTGDNLSSKLIYPVPLPREIYLAI